MYHGLQAGFNSQLLSGISYSSFPSSYFFLPPSDDNVVLTHDLKEIQLPLWDPERWLKNNWGIFQKNSGVKKTSLAEMKKFLELWLSRARKFQELTLAPLESFPSPTPILYFQGTGTKTTDRGIWMQSARTQENIFLFYSRDFFRWKQHFAWIQLNLVASDGDSLIPSRSSELPPAFREIGAHTVKAKLNHLDVLQKASQQNHLTQFLSESAS